MLQAQSALETAQSLYELGNFSKSLEYIDKVVLVFSPDCTKVTFLCSFCSITIISVLWLYNFTIESKSESPSIGFGWEVVCMINMLILYTLFSTG